MGVGSNFRLTAEQVSEVEELRLRARAVHDASLLRKSRVILLIGRDGRTREEAAEICEASVRSIYTWQRAYREQGISGLLRGKHTGRPRLLSDGDLELLSDIVEMGPEVAGYDTGRWTAALVGELIYSRFGVRYAIGHVRRILHDLGFSVQYPKKNWLRLTTLPRRVGLR